MPRFEAYWRAGATPTIVFAVINPFLLELVEYAIELFCEFLVVPLGLGGCRVLQFLLLRLLLCAQAVRILPPRDGDNVSDFVSGNNVLWMIFGTDGSSSHCVTHSLRVSM